MAEPVEDGFLREIDEELRQENFAKLWKKYGHFIIGAAIVLVASVAGYKAWQGYDLKERSRQSVEFSTALKLGDDKKATQALETLGKLEADAGAGYTLLSRFQSARILNDQGDARAAAEVYDTIAADSSSETLYRDMAVILGTVVRMSMDGAETSALATRLAPLAADDNPWRFSAREMMAVLAIQSGDKAKARELLTALTGNRNAPGGIARRAAEMLAALAK